MAFGKIALSKYCNAEDVQYLITDKDIPEEYSNLFSDAEVEIIIPVN